MAVKIAPSSSPTSQTAATRPALDALQWYVDKNVDFEDGNQILFCRARVHPLLKPLADKQVTYEQTFLPYAAALNVRGKEVRQSIDEDAYDIVLYPGSRHKNETLWYLSNCYHALRQDGILLFALENNNGAASYRKLFEQAGFSFETESKKKSRIYCLKKTEGVELQHLENWRSLADSTNASGYISHPAAFSSEKPDSASEFLMSCIEKLSGVGADLGAGYGYLASTCASRFSAIEQIDLYEAELHALGAARKNLAQDSRIAYYWADVQQGIPSHRYDWIIMNPPYHIERQHSLTLLRSFIAQARLALKSSGELFCVSQKSFPLADILKQHFRSIERLKTSGTFECYQAKP